MSLFSFAVTSPVTAAGHEGAEVVSLDELVVTAKKITEYIRNHPQRVVSLGRSEIDEGNFFNLGEALGSMSGVEVRERGAGMGASISIRGSGKGSGVLVLINGRPVNSSQYGSVNLNNISIDMVERITVYKPPVPVWIGSGASEGAINIETRSSAREKSPAGRNSSTLKLSGGSYGVATAGYSLLVPRHNGGMMLTASAKHHDGKRSNSDRDSGGFSFHWDRKIAALTSYEVNGRLYISEHGSAGPTYNPTPDAWQDYSKAAFDFRLEGVTGENSEYSIKAYVDRTDLEDKSQTGVISELDVTKIGLKGENTWAAADGAWALRLGGQGETEAIDYTMTGEHRRQTLALSGQLDRDFGKLASSLGLRGDYTNDFDFAPAFTGGLSYELGPKSLFKVNIGYTVNAPSFGQLYQSSHGSYDQARGNPDLDEEEVWACDLGLEHRFDKGRTVQATLFRSDYRDQIIYVRGNDLISRPENVSSSWRQGLELALKYQLSAVLGVDISYIWQKSENEETGGSLTYTPEHQGKITVKRSFADGTRLEVALRAANHRYTDPENSAERRLAGYSTVDIKLIRSITVKQLGGEVYLNGYNLLDADYELHQSYPDDGVRFMAGLNLNF
ncbi:MAG: TonB-dependent receptor [Desulfuromonas sp.]|nr:TonB-dependent receptor [Desulfuromonas sp.]